jgi:quinol monooxygenase YgiN
MANSYTLATYRVRPGQQEEFIEAWHKLAKTFSDLNDPPQWGTLIRHATDRTLFHGFGPWRDDEHIDAMRTNPAAMAAYQRIADFCTYVSPGNYEVVEHIDLERQSKVGEAIKRSDPRAGNRRIRG